MRDQIRLIATDIDDTLVPRFAPLPQINRDALIRAKQQGIHVCPCTGRSLHTAKKAIYENDLTMADYWIVNNGACIADHTRDVAVYENCMDSNMLESILNTILSYGLHYTVNIMDQQLSSEEGLPQEFSLAKGTANGQLFIHPDNGRTLRMYDNMRELIRDNWGIVHKVNVFYDPSYDYQNFYAEIREKYALEPENSYYAGGEMTASGVSKGSAIAKLAEIYNVPQQQVMAMGDNDNDREIIQWAGLGVAVANAKPAIMDIADEIVPDTKEGGAGYAIETFALGRF